MASPVRIAVIGAAGKMGRAIMKVVLESDGMVLAVAADRGDAPDRGKDAAFLAGSVSPAGGVVLREALPAKGEADVWIDFSAAHSSVGNAAAAVAAGVALVIGTTGVRGVDKEQIALSAQKTPLILSPNTSVGVNVLCKLVADAARLLGPDFDLEIVEAHHRMKKDAPSGTALRLAEVLAAATNRDLETTAVYGRKGDVGARTAAEIGIQTVRGGDVVGDHTVYFFGMGERIELVHRASSRDTFARGAVRAALWLVGKPAGRLYDMNDVLGL